MHLLMLRESNRRRSFSFPCLADENVDDKEYYDSGNNKENSHCGDSLVRDLFLYLIW